MWRFHVRHSTTALDASSGLWSALDTIIKFSRKTNLLIMVASRYFKNNGALLKRREEWTMALFSIIDGEATS